jgi:iron complex outermembrane recepter protein
MKKYQILIIFLFFIQIISLYSIEIKDTMKVKTSEVVVTALRYPEYLLEVPLSISLINKASFSNIKGQGLDEALKTIPGVFAQSRYGGQDVRITIRGFGARGAGDRSNAGTSRGIKFYQDGIPETEPDGRTSFDNIDLSLANGIEVIRSNASAVWGNAAGGVVSISNFSLIDKPYANVGFSAGDFGFTKYTIQAGTPKSDGYLGALFSASKYDGYRDNSNSEKYLLNTGIVSMLGQGTRLGVYLLGVSNKFYIPGPLTQSQFDSLPEMANPTYLQRQENRFNRSGRIGITLDHEFNSTSLLSTMVYLNPKYLQRSERGTFRDFNRYHIGGSMKFYKFLELSKELKNTIVAGVDESYQDGAVLFYYLTADAKRDSLKTDKREGANSFGGFIQDELIWNDKISLLLGLRYDNVSYYNELYYEDNKHYVGFGEDKTFTHITPKIAISYRFSPEHAVFLSYGGGVEVPAGNETDPEPGASNHLVNTLLEPIISSTVELGDKFSIRLGDGFFRNMFQEVSIYMINTKNDIIPYSGGKFYTSAGETQRIGFEYGIGLEMDYGLSLNAAVTYSDNKYKDYTVDSVLAGAFADYSNNKMAGLPGFYYNATIRWQPDFLWGIYTEVNLQGADKYFADDANKYVVPSYTIINATIGTGQPINVFDGIKAKMFLSVNNLTDSKYAASAFINPDLDKKTKQPMFLEAGLPRNFVIGLNLIFD